MRRSDGTGSERGSDEYHDDIREHMRWLGLEWDEGIDVGGPHGSYRKSDRFDRYRDVANDLLESGSAYYSFATPDQLDGFRRAARENWDSGMGTSKTISSMIHSVPRLWRLSSSLTTHTL